jgi:adenine C2-methylase RlmN of 23S rRNA A2503 and tRNA A37
VEKAQQISTCDGGIHLQEVLTSSDGTQKLLFSIDGLEKEQIETVLIPVVRKQVCLVRYRSSLIHKYG